MFADRDRTADSVVRVARGLWDQWGPRMQSILEHTVKTLHEANEHSSTKPTRSSTPSWTGWRCSYPTTKFRNSGAEEGLRPLHPGVVGPGLRQLAPPVPGRGPGSGADPPLLLRLLQAGAGHPGPATLHHRPAGSTIHDGGILLVSTAQGIRRAGTWPPWWGPPCSTWWTR